MNRRPDWSGVPRVDERGPVDRDAFATDIRGGDRPIVLRGQAADWPLVRAGERSSEDLCTAVLAHANDRPVRYFEAPPEVRGRFSFSDDLLGFNFERREAPLGTLLDRLRALREHPDPPGLYAGAIPVPDHLPGLDRENDPGLLEPGVDRLVSLWIGNRSRTAAHFDLPQNLACVLSGRRRFILLPIEQLPNLYLGPLDRTLAGQATSLVDFLDPDHEAHPRFRDALPHAQVAELEPGDVLYLPSLWFHHVESLDPLGAMLNVWWRDAPDYMFTPMITLMHSLLSIRELPERERRAWRTVFDHYVFQVDGDPVAHLPEAARGLFGTMTPEKLQRLRYYLVKALGGRT